MFYSGQKIVCISDSWIIPDGFPWPPGWTLPKKDSIYHFDKMSPFYGANGSRYVILIEYPPDEIRWRAFISTNFRPLIDKKFDISVFRSLTDPTNQKTKERA